MKRNLNLGFTFYFLAILACGGKNPSTSSATLPPNVRMFHAPYSLVWKAVVETLRLDYLVSLPVTDQKKGFFSSEMIREVDSQVKTRYRISGNITFDGQAMIVTLYRQVEIEERGSWRTVPSDLVLEQRILSDIAKKLKTKPQQN